MRLDPQLRRDAFAPRRVALVEPGEPRARQVAQDPDVVEAEPARADDADARPVAGAQNPTPRSLPATKSSSAAT